MSRRPAGPTWPVIGLLLVLFALSITAPMNWNRRLPATGPNVLQSSFDAQVEPFATAQIIATADEAIAEAARLDEPVASDASATVVETLDAALSDANSSAALDLGTHLSSPLPPTLVEPAESPSADALAFDPLPIVPSGLAVILPRAPFANPWPALASRPDTTPRLDTIQGHALTAGPLPHIGDAAELNLTVNDAAPAEDDLERLPATEPKQRLELADESQDAAPTTPLPGSASAPALQAVLAPLAGDAAFGGWATDVEAAASRLAREGVSPEVVVALRDLEARAVGLIVGHPQQPRVAEMRRAAHAVARRMPAWELAAAARAAPRDTEAADADWQAISSCLAALEDGPVALVGAGDRQQALLEALGDLAMQNDSRRSSAAQVARQFLVEWSRRKPTPRRQTADHTLTKLIEELRPLAVGDFDPCSILAHVESFEAGRDAATAAAVAADLQRLALTEDADQARLGQWLEEQYRGGNFRVSISHELLDRLTDQPTTVEGPIRQMVLGVPTTGYSTTSTKVRYRLIPDPSRWRVHVVAEGQVAADTQAESGPARLFNRSDSSFTVEKEVVLTPRGLLAQPARAQALSDTQLRGVESDFDWVPVLRRLAHNVIRKEYAARRGAARMEAQAAISQRAEGEVDAQVSQRLARANEQLQRHILQPLERLGLETNCNFQTTSQRLTARVRIAGPAQLAAHTPRPQAPADSQASVQIHESSLCNVLDRLDVAGKTLTLPELYTAVCQKLNLGSGAAPESMPADVLVTLAAQQPLRVDLQDGQLKITMSFAHVQHGGDHWRDFRVMVFYRPDLSAPGAPLVRDGVVQLAGKSVRAKGQVALRGVFSKTFPKDEPWQLMPQALIDDPRLADLTVTQFVVQDGWIGWALGPKPGQAAADAITLRSITPTQRRPHLTAQRPLRAPHGR